MESINSKSKFLLIKYLLVTGVLTAIGIILATLTMVTIMGERGSGYAIGIALGPAEIAMIGLQILCSLAIAYFIGPMTVNAIRQGQSGTYVGIKSLSACWAAPWILLTLITAIPELSWDLILISGAVGIIPAVVIGPIIGRAIKKKIMKEGRSHTI